MPNQTAHEKIRELVETIDQAKTLLKQMKGSDGTGLNCSPESIKKMDTWGKEPTTRDSLSNILSDLDTCQRCKLHSSRTNLVFGIGNPEAKLVFVGEGPGYEEDMQGKPFVGAAGQLLTKIIEAMGLKRENVFICNIIKCRAPKNRNPEPDEIAACLPFLERQIQVIQPEFICALGSIAARTLLKTDTPISKLRGHFHSYMNIRVMPTFHPAYLLRNPNAKRAVWEDVQQIMKAMELEIP